MCGAAKVQSRNCRAERDLDKIPVTTLEGKQISFGDMPALTYADGLLVLHRGKIIYE